MTTTNKYTILVVDDEEALRSTIVFDFKRKGFNVFDTDNAATALELVLKEKIDLVLSDMRMPKEDGISLLEKIRALHPSIPVFFLITGFADITEEECLKKGARGVIQKPFDRKTLMNSVFAALNIPLLSK